MSEGVIIEAIRAIGPTLAALGGVVGLILQNRKTDRRVKVVESHLTPNHGTSLRDAVDRIERRLDDHLAQAAGGGRRRRRGC